jgi:hypothetical protein
MESKPNALSFEKLQDIITSGGDERILLNAEGVNKYHINPVEYQGIFNRASCTCSPLNETSHQALVTFYDRVQNEGFEKLKKEQKRRLRRLIRSDENVDIAFAPSGSDLCYYPLFFRKLLSPDKPIMNLVTCPEELGSGSIIANGGKFYGGRNQLNESLVKNERLSPDLDIQVMTFSARDSEGHIMDHRDQIAKMIEQYRDTHALIGNIVIGSKSGIADNLSVVREFQDDIIWVVDLCQLRANTHIVRKLLGLNCLIMITGSKFYQSPPFSGALIIPESISERLKKVNSDVVYGMDRVYSRTDLPECISQLEHHFTNLHNHGLMFRWETAIQEMEHLAKLTEERVTDIIDKWNKTLVKRIKHSAYFELMQDQSRTNNSIISLKVKIGESYLGPEEMAVLYRQICNTPPGGALSEFNRVIIGQPVAYTNHTFIRLALGSYNIRKLAERRLDFTLDLALVDHIEHVIQKNWL